jgi:hypothetical protein
VHRVALGHLVRVLLGERHEHHRELVVDPAPAAQRLETRLLDVAQERPGQARLFGERLQVRADAGGDALLVRLSSLAEDGGGGLGAQEIAAGRVGREEALLLVGEVLEERGARHTSAGDDVVDRDFGVGLGGQRLGHAGDQPAWPGVVGLLA